MIAVRVLAFVLGAAIVFVTLASAVKTFVLPRGARDALTSAVFRLTRVVFDLRVRSARTYEQRDHIMAMYAPVALLALLPAWLVVIAIGYACIYWALGTGAIREDVAISGSALLTVGGAAPHGALATLAAFSEATIGLILVALLIAYLPTIYTAFSRRETAVALLEVRAGSPPSAAEMIERYQRIHGLEALGQVWINWEQWFADIEESHTSLGALAFFRSQQPDRSWITAAGAVLDTASIAASTLDIPRDPQADLCIRAGFLALRRIAAFFRIAYNPNPQPDDPISIGREEFDALYDELASHAVPLKPDRDQCWRDFAGWRVNYDTVLLALCALTMAPYAPWSSDRSLRVNPPHWWQRRARR